MKFLATISFILISLCSFAQRVMPIDGGKLVNSMNGNQQSVTNLASIEVGSGTVTNIATRPNEIVSFKVLTNKITEAISGFDNSNKVDKAEFYSTNNLVMSILSTKASTNELNSTLTNEANSRVSGDVAGTNYVNSSTNALWISTTNLVQNSITNKVDKSEFYSTNDNVIARLETKASTNNVPKWDDSWSWGNHALAGYLLNSWFTNWVSTNVFGVLVSASGGLTASTNNGIVTIDGSSKASTNDLNNHVTNSVIHITGTERTNWNAKAETTITNGLASIGYVNSATTGLVTASITNSLASIDYVNSATTGLVTASITNSLASIDYVNSATTGLVTASITNGVFTSITNEASLRVLGDSAGTNNVTSATNALWIATTNAINQIPVYVQTNQLYVGQAGTAQVAIVSGSANIVTGNQSNTIETTFNWGDHSLAGYLLSSWFTNWVSTNAYSSHIINDVVHITGTERTNWNAKAETTITNGLASIDYVNSATTGLVTASITNNVFTSITNETALRISGDSAGTNYVDSATNKLWSSTTNAIAQIPVYVQTNQLYVAQAGTSQVAVVSGTVTGPQSNAIASALQSITLTNTSDSAGIVSGTGSVFGIGTNAPISGIQIGTESTSWNPVTWLTLKGTNGIQVSYDSLSANHLTLDIGSSNLVNHLDDYTIHITNDERTNWNSKAGMSITNGLASTDLVNDVITNEATLRIAGDSASTGLVTSATNALWISTTNAISQIPTYVQTNQLYVGQAGTAQVSIVSGTVTGPQSNTISTALQPSALDPYYLNSNPSNYVTLAQIPAQTNQLYVAQAGMATTVTGIQSNTIETTFGWGNHALAGYLLNSWFTNWVSTNVFGVLVSASGGLTATTNNGVVTIDGSSKASTNDLNVHVTNAVVHITGDERSSWNDKAETTITNGLASVEYVNLSTNGLVTKSVTNGLASIDYVNSATTGLVTASITNGVFTSITNEASLRASGDVAGTNYVNSATNALWISTTNAISSSTNGLVTASITNGLAHISYVNSATTGLVTASITNGVFSSITNETALRISGDSGLTGLVQTATNALWVTTTNAISTATNGFVTSSITNGVFTSITNETQLRISGDSASSNYVDNATNKLWISTTNAIAQIPTYVQTNQLYVGQAGTAQVSIVSGTVTGPQSNTIASALQPSALDPYYLNSNPSNYVTLAQIPAQTNQLYVAQAGTAQVSVVSGTVTGNQSNTIETTFSWGNHALAGYLLNSWFTNWVSTNSLASISYVNSATNGLWISTTNAINSATNGLVTASITNGLAPISYVNSATTGLVTASITNGVFTSITNEASLRASGDSAGTNYVNSATNGVWILTTNLVTGATNSLWISTTNAINTHVTNSVLHITSGERSSWNAKAETNITNGLASISYVNSATTGLVTASITNGVFASITNEAQLRISGDASGTNYVNSATNSLWILTTNLVTSSTNSLWIATTNAIRSATNGLVTASITNGVFASITNETALRISGDNSGTNYVNSSTNGLWILTTNIVTGATNSLWGATTNAITSATNALWGATTNLVNVHATNAVVHITSGERSAWNAKAETTITNGLASIGYVNSATTGLVTASITNGVFASITNETALRISGDSGLTSLVQNATNALWVSTTNNVTASINNHDVTNTAHRALFAGKVNTNDSRFVNAITNGQSNFFIQSDGNVGIGTLTPSWKGMLTVAGNIGVIGGKNLQFGIDGGGGSLDYAIGMYGTDFRFSGADDFTTQRHFRFGRFSGETWITVFDINSYSGYVGIGTDNPSEKLHVSGNILASGTITASNLFTIAGTTTNQAVVSPVGTNNIAKLWQGTYAEYLALAVKDDATQYTITDDALLYDEVGIYHGVDNYNIIANGTTIIQLVPQKTVYNISVTSNTTFVIDSSLMNFTNRMAKFTWVLNIAYTNGLTITLPQGWDYTPNFNSVDDYTFDISMTASNVMHVVQTHPSTISNLTYVATAGTANFANVVTGPQSNTIASALQANSSGASLTGITASQVGALSNLQANVSLSGNLTITNGTGTTGINVVGNTNAYFQMNIQNLSSGSSASSDYVATADNGSATTKYIDMGINGSTGGATPFTGTNAGYLYTSDGPLHIGSGVVNSTNTSSISFYVGTGTVAKVVISSNDMTIAGAKVLTTNDLTIYQDTSSLTTAVGITNTITVLPTVPIYKLTATNLTTVIAFNLSNLDLTNHSATWETFITVATTNVSLAYPSTNSVYYIVNPTLTTTTANQTLYAVWRAFVVGSTTNIFCNQWLSK